MSLFLVSKYICLEMWKKTARDTLSVATVKLQSLEISTKLNSMFTYLIVILHVIVSSTGQEGRLLRRKNQLFSSFSSQKGKLSKGNRLPSMNGAFTNSLFLLVISLYKIQDISEYNEYIFFLFYSPVVIIICGTIKLSRLM